MTDEELDRLEAILAAATPGTWEEHEDVPRSLVSSGGPNESLLMLDKDNTAIVGSKADHAAIVALHNAAPELLRLARRGQQAERETCKTCAERMLHGRVPWCHPMTGRRNDDGYCDAWRGKDGG